MEMRLPAWREHLVCATCPSLAVPLGQFDVAAKPSRESEYRRDQGYRIDRRTGAPVCVHPDRVGLPADSYASGHALLPWQQEPAGPPPLPEQPDGLDAWLTAYLTDTPPALFDQALERAQDLALDRFDGAAVVDAMRRVLGSGQFN